MEPNYVYRDGNGQPTDEPSLRAAYTEELEGELKATSVQYLGPAPEPEPAPKPTILTNEDRLLAENLALKVQNLTLVKERVIHDANAKLEQLNQQIKAVQAEITQVQSKLSNKYAIDFTKQQIEPGTGRIIPG